MFVYVVFYVIDPLGAGRIFIPSLTTRDLDITLVCVASSKLKIKWPQYLQFSICPLRSLHYAQSSIDSFVLFFLVLFLWVFLGFFYF